jgi:hypothetical protein
MTSKAILKYFLDLNLLLFIEVEGEHNIEANEEVASLWRVPIILDLELIDLEDGHSLAGNLSHGVGTT